MGQREELQRAMRDFGDNVVEFWDRVEGAKALLKRTERFLPDDLHEEVRKFLLESGDPADIIEPRQ